jgi:hypothetical protein
MYLNAGQKPAYMRSKSPQKKQLLFPEPIAQTIKQNGVKTGVTEQNLKDTSGRRITFKN